MRLGADRAARSRCRAATIAPAAIATLITALAAPAQAQVAVFVPEKPIIGVSEPFLETGEAAIKSHILTGKIHSLRVAKAANAVKAAAWGASNMACIVGDLGGGDEWNTLVEVWKPSNRQSWEDETLQEVEACVKTKAVAVIEIGNEMYLKGREANRRDAGIYGQLCLRLITRAAKRGLSPTFLASAPVERRRSIRRWLAPMFGAVPELEQLLGGLAVHPYGPASGPTSHLTSMAEQHTWVTGKMQYPYTYVTEYGVECNPCTSEGQSRQAEETKQVYTRLKELSWVKGIWYFNFVDEPRVSYPAPDGLFGWYPRTSKGVADFSKPRPVRAVVESFA
jgi:hypothetical protein